MKSKTATSSKTPVWLKAEYDKVIQIKHAYEISAENIKEAIGVILNLVSMADSEQSILRFSVSVDSAVYVKSIDCGLQDTLLRNKDKALTMKKN